VTKLLKLPSGHSAIKYLQDRKIPVDRYDRFYYTDNFKEFVNSVEPGKFQSTERADPRLVLPLCDFNGHVTGVIGRTITNDSMRYYTIKFKEDSPRFYGLNYIDRNLKVYVTEGPIDSLFLPNAVAMASTDANFELFKNFTIILDNQPRNKEVLQSYNK